MNNKILENPVIGDKVVILKSAAETGGAYSLFEITLAPGGGNTLHLHKEFSETFQALNDEVMLIHDKEEILLMPGKQFVVAPNMLHCFKNPSPHEITFRVMLQPGHEGFENCIKIGYALAREGLTDRKSIPRNFSYLSLLVTMSGTYPAGIFSMLMPLFKWKARRARKKGIEKMLMDKYCS